MTIDKLASTQSPELSWFDEIYLKESRNLDRRIEGSTSHLEATRRRRDMIDPDPANDARRAAIAITIAMETHTIQQLKAKREFLRPSSEEDIAYRQRVEQELPGHIRAVVPPDSLLRFHGCPIDAARDIIESGEISSSVDRLGGETSYDIAGQISVTSRDNVEVTLGSYTALNGDGTFNYCMPTGCVFVLRADPDEADGIKGLLMGNAYFREQPSKLQSIMTSGENLDQVREWAAAGGIDPEKVVEFFSFEGEEVAQAKL